MKTIALSGRWYNLFEYMSTLLNALLCRAVFFLPIDPPAIASRSGEADGSMGKKKKNAL
jgi:hypothetical protein